MTNSLAWSICTHLTVSVWPTMVTLQAIDDQEEVELKSQTLMVRSVLPLTRRFPSRWRHLTSPEWPARVMTDQGELVFTFHTLIVLSCDPLTIR